MMLDKLKKATMVVAVSAITVLPFATNALAAISVTGVTNGAIYNDARRIGFSADSGSATATLNGTSIANNTLVSNEGSYLLTVTTRSEFKNVRFSIDHLPVITVSGVTNGLVTNQSVRPVFSANEGSVSATLNGVAFTSNTLIATDGSYLLTVTARDAVGQVTYSNTRFTIDKTAPVITINGVVNGGVYDSTVGITYSANEGAVAASLNGSSFASGSFVSSVGSYRLIVTATDAAGNVSSRTVDFVIQDSGNGGNTTNNTYNTYNNGYSTYSNYVGAVSTAQAAESTTNVITYTEDDLKNISITDVYNVGDAGNNADSCDNVTIVGKAKEGLLVILYLKRDGSDVPVIGFVKAGAGDRFEFTTNEPLADGNYTLYAKAAVEGGITGPLLELTKFTVNDCQVSYIWLWLLIILALILLALIIAWLSTRNKEEREEDSDKDENYRSRI